MRIAVIGCGFTGLSVAYQLSKLGQDVTIFEKDENPGGLAVGFKDPKWNWTLEKHYHHWFTNDASVLNLAKEINYSIVTERPKTSTYINGSTFQLDSVFSLIKFPELSIFDRIRMASVLGILKYNPFWQLLEGIRSSDFLPKTMGTKAYEAIWKPLFINKFGKYINDISLAWFWARIKKRTSSLSYPQGGFLDFANALVKKIKENRGKFLFNTDVKEIKNNGNTQVKFEVRNSKLEVRTYDKVVVTLPSFFFMKIAPQLPSEYKNKLSKLIGLGAANLVLRLSKPFLQDGTYWLSICDKTSPLVAIVEHTNFMDKKYYNNEYIVYLGKYLSSNHPYMKCSAQELLKIYDPYLKKINPSYQSSIIDYQLFKVPFAQPVIPINYSKIIPAFETPLTNVYLANIQQVYPWDRGTNYAIELGEKVAKLVINS